MLRSALPTFVTAMLATAVVRLVGVEEAMLAAPAASTSRVSVSAPIATQLMTLRLS